MPETVFSNVQYQLATLVSNIELGQIGLPDIQRPFVWENAKVRDLLDSMYRGFPVGHLLLWASGAEPGARQIGDGTRQVAPQLLIVDGQQRLTSLFAVMKGQQVIGTDYRPRLIRIAFRPRDEVFAVADAATDRDPAFLRNVSDIWTRSTYSVISETIGAMKTSGVIASSDDEEQVAHALNRLANLANYPFTALQLGADVSEEQVAEVFVRINSKGKNLNQADFILTLMSVHWDEGRAALEHWSRRAHNPGTPEHNHFLIPEPADLLRVVVMFGFRRGRLEDAYAILRGRDPASGQVSETVRQQQFATLAAAQTRVLDAGVWKDFLQSLVLAGNRSSGTISSTNAVLFAYALYLIGKYDFRVPPKQLREVIARWFFASALTSRFSASPETRMQADLAVIPASGGADDFVRALDAVIDRTLTNDYWQITLPNELATSASRSPALFGYVAALNVLGARVLFSKMRSSDLLDPNAAGGRAKLERHHLFPRKFLETLGIVDLKQVNQIANYALLEWHDNLAISADDPNTYWPAYLDAMRHPPAGSARFTESEIAEMVRHHALPEGWPAMEYEAFLETRRRLMAAVIKDAFEKLRAGDVIEPASTWPPEIGWIEHVLAAGETTTVEMKSSLRADTLGRGVPPKTLEKIIARTVAGFLNQRGGMLVIGADDDGNPLGLDADLATLSRKDMDGFQQALVNTIERYLGGGVAAGVRICIVRIGADEKPLALVDCPPWHAPVFLADGDAREFHVRAGNTTRLLNVEEAAIHIARRFAGSTAP